MKLIERPEALDLEQSHAKRRVLFVGKHWWETVKRPVTRWVRDQVVKEHGLWTFVFVPDADDYFLAEIPVLNNFMARRHARAIRGPKVDRIAPDAEKRIERPRPPIH